MLPNSDLPFRMFEFEGKDGNYRRSRHWHSSIEIFAVFEGELRFLTPLSETILTSGRFIIVNSNEIHSIDAPLQNHTVVLQIPVSFFEEYFTDKTRICFEHGDGEQDVELMRLIREMYDLYEEKSLGYKLRVTSRMYELIYQMIARYRMEQVDEEMVRSRKNLGKLTEITNYMKQHYAEELSLEVLAEIFGYTGPYLSRMFQKYAGLNYKAYLQSIRLRHACREMEQTEEELGEIAVRNGFPDGRAFAKAFRKEYGMLPSAYRREKKNTEKRKTEKEK